MKRLEPEKKKNRNIVFRWIFGVLFLTMCFSAIVEFHIIASLLFLLAAILSIPPLSAKLEKNSNYRISGMVRFFVVFIIVMFASSALPSTGPTTSLNNSTDTIAAPITSAHDTTTISVPAPPEVATTPDNKGILDIITSPKGAFVTVDGVSQGLSPVTGLSVDEGKHTVDLYLSGYNPKTLTVYIASSGTKTIDWTFTPYVEPSPTPTETPEVTPTETPEVTPTETPEETKAQVTTSDSKSTTTSNTIITDSKLLYASSESDVYHVAGCFYIERIKPEHLITFDSIQEAEAAGYRACKRCG